MKHRAVAQRIACDAKRCDSIATVARRLHARPGIPRHFSSSRWPVRCIHPYQQGDDDGKDDDQIRRSWLWLAGIIACAFVALFAMTREVRGNASETGARCSINADCGSAMCVDGLCMRSAAPECRADSDCGPNSVCAHDRTCYRF